MYIYIYSRIVFFLEILIYCIWTERGETLKEIRLSDGSEKLKAARAPHHRRHDRPKEVERGSKLADRGAFTSSAS